MKNYQSILLSSLLVGTASFANPTGAPTQIPEVDCEAFNLPTNSNASTIPVWVMSGCSSSAPTDNTTTNTGEGGGYTALTTTAPTTSPTTTLPTDSNGDTYTGEVVISNNTEVVNSDDGSTTTITSSSNSDGSTTTTQLQIPSNDDAESRFTITTKVEGDDPTTGEKIAVETKVTLDKDAKTEISSDGAVSSILDAGDGTTVEISVKSDGDIVLTVEKSESDGAKAKATITLPKGTNLDATKTKTDASTLNIKADDNDVTIKPVELKVSADHGNRNMKLDAVITNSNGASKIVSLSSKSFALDEVINLIKGKPSSLRAIERGEIYTGIISEFSSKASSFNLPDDTNPKATIHSLSTTQKYQDRQYFDGKRTITLLEGEASLQRGDIVESMLPGVEYLIGEVFTQTTEDIVDILTANSPYPIDGYWYYMGGDEWDWIYCLAASGGCYKLQGFDTTNSAFTYNSARVLKPQKAHDGYSVRFGGDAWDYTYSSATLQSSLYKLQRSATGFEWSMNLGEQLKTFIDEEYGEVGFTRR